MYIDVVIQSGLTLQTLRKLDGTERPNPPNPSNILIAISKNLGFGGLGRYQKEGLEGYAGTKEEGLEG